MKIPGNGLDALSVMLTTAVPKEKPSYPTTTLVVGSEPPANLVGIINTSLHDLTGQLAPPEHLGEVDLSDGYSIVLAMGESLLLGLDQTGLRYI